jgi:lysophospholipase L1-like esterase
MLIVSLALNVAGAATFATRVIRKGGMRYLLERFDLRDAKHPLLPFQADRRTQLRKLPNTEAEIAFAGDSLIADGPWAELYSPIKNRGIGGETTAGLLDRLDEVTESQPRKIFLLVGTNCLAADIPVAQVVRNYRKILEQIRRDSPQTRVFVISVLPVNQQLARGGPVHDNATIRELNQQLRDLAGGFERVAFLDVFDALTDAHGNLRDDLTTDGLHLNIDGYLILGRLLEGHVTDRIGQAR